MFRNARMSLEFSASAQAKIAALCQRYPTKKPVVLAALHLAQKEFGHLSDDAQRLVAKTLDLPLAHVYGVATFYTMFRLKPGGAQTIRMCTNISCMLRGGYDVLSALESKLGVKAGGTSADGEFTLIEEECLAACANAPCMISGHKYFLDLTPQSAVAALDEIKQMPPDHAPPRGKNHGRHAGDSHDDEIEHRLAAAEVHVSLRGDRMRAALRRMRRPSPRASPRARCTFARSCASRACAASNCTCGSDAMAFRRRFAMHSAIACIRPTRSRDSSSSSNCCRKAGVPVQWCRSPTARCNR